MEAYLFFSLVSFLKSLPYENPALIDIVKVVTGSTLWIGGILTYIYWRERKLKTIQASK